jgi:hypothetical protein
MSRSLSDIKCSSKRILGAEQKRGGVVGRQPMLCIERDMLRFFSEELAATFDIAMGHSYARK